MSSTVCEADKLPSLASTQPCVRFSLIEIQSATEDFDDELVIGQGGFGKVYKGCISFEETSHVVAIKRLDSKSEQGAPEFRAEIEMLSRLRHCHLVSLIGYCDDNEEMILVYAYMPHGTLYHHLHKAETPLNWVQRLKIAIGAGRGLDYLHTGFGTQHGVIHRDVKSSNILLDENWEAMISDFGLSKIGPTNQSTSYVDASVKGTFGYLDPEYFYTRKLTRKTDVYAFGVVLFELLSGRLAVDERNGEDQCSLVRWAQMCVKERKLDQMVDVNIRGTIFPKCLRGFAQVADRCLRSVLKDRPTMAEVVVSLQALFELQKKCDSSAAESYGVTGFTWKIHKYLIPEAKHNADQCGTSSSKSPENNMNRYNSTNKVGKDLKCFRYSEMRSATNNFQNGAQLSGKSCKMVYKGWIDKTTYSPSKENTGLAITIKRFDFYKPVRQLNLNMLKEFSHTNLVKLIGYCLEGKKVFLVYEFMPNGNFEDLLDSGAIARLPLVTKVKIAVGIARGIVFLHKTQDQVPENRPWDAPVSKSQLDRHKILLDEDFTAKLSDYDVTKLLHGGYSEYYGKSNGLHAGDYYPGYDPVELQSDLLGFSVVFVEVLTGKNMSVEYQIEEIPKLFMQHGNMSLVDIACKCFRICNELDSESRVLRILEQNGEFTTGAFKGVLCVEK